MQRIAYYFDSVESLPLSDRYTRRDGSSTRSAQVLLDLPETGVRGWRPGRRGPEPSWPPFSNPDRDAGQADATGLHERGERGPDVGQIEQWLNGRYMRICGETMTENFRSGPKETEGVRERADLLVTGTVNEETWEALQPRAANARRDDGWHC